MHKLVCAGTLEERIAQIIDDKRALAGKIIETAGAKGEGWITELDDEALAVRSWSPTRRVSPPVLPDLEGTTSA